MLYNKWWGKDLDTLHCPKRESDLTKASALNLVNIGGIFVVLLCGLSIALMVRFLLLASIVQYRIDFIIVKLLTLIKTQDFYLIFNSRSLCWSGFSPRRITTDKVWTENALMQVAKISWRPAQISVSCPETAKLKESSAPVTVVTPWPGTNRQ